MLLSEMLFDREALHSLEGFLEVGLDLVSNDLCGLGFNISPATELSTAGLTFDGGVIGYGFGHFESGLPAFAAIKFDADFVFGHDQPPVEKQT
jgi:hypothetical protein